ncbi:MAG TPA: hypothetical protein VIQ97_01830, partial [Prevotella sp.]
MKRILLIILAVFGLSSAQAQQTTTKTDSVTLSEVVIRGAKVINKVDGQQLFPSAKLKEAATSAYGLLGKMALPNILVDEVRRTISAVGILGSVQVRINDVEASRDELLALDPKSVTYVDYIRTPGMRYGSDVGFVINIVTTRATQGYTLGASLTQPLTAPLGNQMAYARLHRGKNQFGMSYSFDYSKLTGQRSKETFSYLLPDQSVYSGTHEDRSAKRLTRAHNLQVAFNRVDSGRYAMQAKFTLNADCTPEDSRMRESNLNGTMLTTITNSTDKTLSPALDLYGNLHLGSHQSLTANVVGTYIHSDYTYYNIEDKAYEYGGRGGSYSLLSEAIYENKLRPFTFSAGMQ